MANAYYHALFSDDGLAIMEKCPVCQDMKDVKDMVTICESHTFHVSCRACTHGLAMHRTVGCPMCRGVLLFENAHELPSIQMEEEDEEEEDEEEEEEEEEADDIDDLMRGVGEDYPGQFQAWHQSEERNEGRAMRFLSPAPSSIRESLSRSPISADLGPSTFSPFPHSPTSPSYVAPSPSPSPSYNVRSPSFQPRIPVSVDSIRISLQQNVNACHIFPGEDGDFDIYTPLTCPLCNA